MIAQSERRNFLAYLLFMALMEAREEDRGRTTPPTEKRRFFLLTLPPQLLSGFSRAKLIAAALRPSVVRDTL